MSDFIKKAKQENDFNNGGITFGNPSSPTTGPDSTLSNRDQSSVEQSLEAIADTAKTEQIGVTNTTNQISSFKTDNAPCNSPKSKPYATIDISEALIQAYGNFVNDRLDWESYSDILFTYVSFENKNCGCYTPVVDLSTLVGSVSLGIIVRKFVKKVGKFQLLTQKVARKKFDIFFYNNRQVYEFTDSYTNATGNKNIISFNKSNYYSPTDIPGSIGLEKTLDNMRQIVRRYKSRISTIKTDISSGNYLDVQDLIDLSNEQIALERGVSELNSIGRKFSDYHLALQNLARRETNRIMNNPSAWFQDGDLQRGFFEVFNFAFGTLTALTIQRPIQCFGSNVELNDNCECVCKSGNDDCESIPLGLWQNIYDYALPGFIPRANELKTCKSCDCNLSPSYLTSSDDPIGKCYCTYCEDGYTWFDGSGCPCLKYFKTETSSITSLIQSVRGKCIPNSELGFNKLWDPKQCEIVCPEGTTLGDGKTCSGYARLEDNNYPRTYYLYRTGCDCVCDGRYYTGGSWPPTCPDGKIWDGSKDICDCIDDNYIQNIDENIDLIP